jgi:CHAT domain-containing protein
LWDIDLNSSTYLLTQFYENWLVRNQPKWKAWSMAQYDLFMNKEHPEWSHFYHWAAFRLIEI